MLRIGLTGGIGSGKSTVSAAFLTRGAELIDTDRIAREIVEPGTPTLAAIAARFGAEVLDGEGRLDRAALARIVFADPAARADLNGLTHPVIAATAKERAERWEGTDRIVILDIPLLTASSLAAYGLDVVVVVDTPVEVAVDRLVGDRGFSEEDARARVAAQISRDERRAMADLVVDNSGTRADLEAELDRVWAALVERARSAG